MSSPLSSRRDDQHGQRAWQNRSDDGGSPLHLALARARSSKTVLVDLTRFTPLFSNTCWHVLCKVLVCVQALPCGHAFTSTSRAQIAALHGSGVKRGLTRAWQDAATHRGGDEDTVRKAGQIVSARPSLDQRVSTLLVPLVWVASSTALDLSIRVHYLASVLAIGVCCRSRCSASSPICMVDQCLCL